MYQCLNYLQTLPRTKKTGEGGIRTRGADDSAHSLSKAAPSAARTPLQKQPHIVTAKFLNSSIKPPTNPFSPQSNPNFQISPLLPTISNL